MKKLITVVLAFATGWLAWSRFHRSGEPASASPAPVVAQVAQRVEPTPVAPAPAPVRLPEMVIKSPKQIASASIDYPQMALVDVLKADNRFVDEVFGTTVTFPEGWSVKQAMRWGLNNRENTVFFQPAEGRAIPSMYYQDYVGEIPDLANAEASLREQARYKEDARVKAGMVDYQNDPDSFVFRLIDGHPTLSYFATYTQNNEMQAEYFTRILGEKGYVMFFVHGPANDVKNLIPAVSQMSGTVKPP